jgi:hypothetical protein
MKNCIRLSLLLGLLLTLCGCALSAPAELYSLPEPSEEYLQLQELIDQEIAAGNEYAAPTEGNYKQSVQLVDVDGDGLEDALAFFRGSDQVPRICIYRNDGENYALALTITGEGGAVVQVDYADLDGGPGIELIVAWQLTGDVRLLRVYSLAGDSGAILLAEDNREFTLADLDGDGRQEVLALRYDESNNGIMSRHVFSAGGDVNTASAPLSRGLLSPSRLRATTLSDGAAALYVEGTLTDSTTTVTDIFALEDGQFRNVTYRSYSGISAARREYPVYAADVDGDKLLEVPAAVALVGNEEDGEYWRFDWYKYDATGTRKPVCSTYHCYRDGWYLILPESLRSGLHVRSEDAVPGERVIVLSAPDAAGELRDAVYLYTLTGENRQERAKLEGREILLETDTTIYALHIPGGSPVTAEEVKGLFRLIYSEWNIGVVGG